jgi:hypothetical protein
MLSSVSHLLGLSQAAVDAIMYSASLDAKAKIWLEVIKSKRVDPDICEVAASAYSRLRSFTEGRNDFCDVFYAKEVVVKLSGVRRKAIIWGWRA